MTAFPSYSFKADASQADQLARTLPDRLNDVINVKDWGAIGDGFADDTASINSAIDYAWELGDISGGSGAIIFFPPGTYFIGSPPLHLDRDSTVKGHGTILKYMGAGKEVSIIRGTYNTVGVSQIWDLPNSFLLTCGEYSQAWVAGIFDLTIENYSTASASGALNVLYSGNEFQLIRCRLIGTVGYVNCGNTFASSTRDCIFINSKIITAADAATRSPLYDRANFVTSTSLIGSVGMYVADGDVINNRISGFDIGIAFSQEQSCLIGNYISRCGVGIVHSLYGGSHVTIHGGPVSPGGWASASGNVICSNLIDRCTWGQYMQSNGTFNTSNIYTGARSGDQAIASPYDPVAIISMNWNVVTHVVTVTTSTHNISGSPQLQLAITTSGGPDPWTSNSTGFITVTGTPAGNTFTYDGPSSAPSTFVSGTWNYAAERSLSVAAATNNLIAASVIDANEVLESVNFSGDFNLSTVLRSMIWAIRGQYGWIPPSPSTNIGGFLFDMCGTATTNNNPSQFMTYVNLPGEANAAADNKPIEGMEFTIIDAQLQGSFGGTVAGGSSTNHYKVRYDGTNWIRVA